MSKRWGESFLKSGLPLEYLTRLKIQSFGYGRIGNWEYPRFNKSENIIKWFEIDIMCTKYFPRNFSDKTLFQISYLLGECKSLEDDTFVILHPITEMDDLPFDDAILNFNLSEYLSEKTQSTLSYIDLATKWGVVVSKSGQKLENSIEKACIQLYSATQWFIKHHLYNPFEGEFNLLNKLDDDRYTGAPISAIPIIVTNAKLYRLHQEINFEKIRTSTKPEEISQEIGWTWYSYNIPNHYKGSILEETDPITLNPQELESIEYQLTVANRGSDLENIQTSFNISQINNSILEELDLLKYKRIAQDRPYWYLIVNVNYLEEALQEIEVIYQKINYNNIKLIERQKKIKSLIKKFSKETAEETHNQTLIQKILNKF